MSPQRSPRPSQQSGFTLIEVLVSVVIFSFGILGLVGLQASAIKMSTDAQQRAEATFLADQLFARMLISDPTTADTFNHKPSGSTLCAPDGAASTNATVVEWLAEVTETFPRAAATEQQIVVSSSTPGQVTVRLCWKNAENDPPHTLEVTNRVQWR